MAYLIPHRHPLKEDELADADMVGYVLMVGLLVIFSGIAFVLATNIAGDEGAPVQSLAAVAEWDSGPGTVGFMLVRAGPSAPYNLDLSAPSGNDARFVLNGRECSVIAGDITVEGTDLLWAVGEKLQLVRDCGGGPLEPRRAYSLTITLAGQVLYQDDFVL